MLAALTAAGAADRDPVERLARMLDAAVAAAGIAAARSRALGRGGRRLQARRARSTTSSAGIFGTAPEAEVLFVSSNGWDAAGAAATASARSG
jgi:2-haloacid dehalogenase